MSRIFYRERNKLRAGDQSPRFAVVGVQGSDMTFLQHHLRKGELEMIAQVIGAELVELPRGRSEHLGEAGGGGKRRPARKKTAARRK